jgi:hypothetical protein
MIGSSSVDVERKVIAILKVLNDSPQPLGARIIAQRLKDYGVSLTERAVRYHLKFMDERGLTYPMGRNGRTITPLGAEELRSALVRDKVGFIIERIELLAFNTTFDLENHTGCIPVNISFFPKGKFGGALRAMKEAFKAGLCVSDLVAIASEGERLGEVIVPEGKVGLATVCSIIINGALLRAGIPMDSRFGGILQIRNNKPLRFVELIYYSGSSLDPSEAFIRAKMTDVRGVAGRGEGKLLANFREIPAICKPKAVEVIAKLNEAGLRGLITMGDVSEPVCEIPVGLNRAGMILLGGLTPVAAAEEQGIEAENHAMSTVMEYRNLIKFWEL